MKLEIKLKLWQINTVDRQEQPVKFISVNTIALNDCVNHNRPVVAPQMTTVCSCNIRHLHRIMKERHFEIIKRFCTLLVKFLIFLIIMPSRSTCLYLRNVVSDQQKAPLRGLSFPLAQYSTIGFVKVLIAARLRNAKTCILAHYRVSCAVSCSMS